LCEYNIGGWKLGLNFGIQLLCKDSVLDYSLQIKKKTVVLLNISGTNSNECGREGLVYIMRKYVYSSPMKNL